MNTNFVPYYDFNRYTTLEVKRTEKHVHHIPLDIVNGLKVHKSPVAKFDFDYKPIPDYCPVKATSHFKRFGEQYGALKEVCQLLGIERVAKVMDETAVKVEKPKVEAKPRKLTQGAMFMELLMAGKLTDDEIFAQVQQQFSLTPDKKSYVNWYRKRLIKQGKTPPQPLGELAPCKNEKKPATTATLTPHSSKKPVMAKHSTATTPHTSGVGVLLAASSRAKTTSSRSGVAKIVRSAKSSREAQQLTSILTSGSILTSSKKAKASGSASSASSTSSKIGKSSRKG